MKKIRKQFISMTFWQISAANLRFFKMAKYAWQVTLAASHCIGIKSNQCSGPAFGFDADPNTDFITITPIVNFKFLSFSFFKYLFFQFRKRSNFKYSVDKGDKS